MSIRTGATEAPDDGADYNYGDDNDDNSINNNSKTRAKTKIITKTILE